MPTRRPRTPPREVIFMFPCPECGHTAEWHFPEGSWPGFGAAQCTRCGHRVETKVEVRDLPPAAPELRK